MLTQHLVSYSAALTICQALEHALHAHRLRQQLAALNASRRLEVGWLLAALGCICCYLVVRFAPFGRGA